MVMRFYAENATSFVQDFSLMEGLVRRLELSASAFRLFLAKLNLVHETILKMRIQELDKMRK